MSDSQSTANQKDRSVRVVAAGKVQPGGGIGMSGIIVKGKR